MTLIRLSTIAVSLAFFVSGCDSKKSKSSPGDKLAASSPSKPSAAAAPQLDLRGLPDVRFPLKLLSGRLLNADPAIIDQSGASSDLSEANTILTYSGKTMQAWSSKDLAPKWTENTLRYFQPKLVMADAGQILLVDPFQFNALSTENGERMWRYPDLDSPTGPEDDLVDTYRIERWVADGKNMVAFNNKSELLCIDATNGRERWTTKLETKNVLYLGANREFAVVATTNRGDAKLISFSMSDGKQRGEWSFPKRSFFEKAVISGDKIVVQTANRIECLSLTTFESIWNYSSEGSLDARACHLSEHGVFMVSDENSLTSIDIKDGASRWNTTFGEKLDYPALYLPGNNLLLLVDESGILAIEYNSGSMLWNRREASIRFEQSPVLTKNALLIIDRFDDESEGFSSRKLRIRGLNPQTGDDVSILPNGPLITNPNRKFGGLMIFEPELFILHGLTLEQYTPIGAHPTGN